MTSSEAVRSAAFVVAYAAGLVFTLFADHGGAVYLLAVALQPGFGFALARWWGFALGPIAISIAAVVSPMLAEAGSEPLPVAFVLLVIAPVLAGLILAGFGVRVAYDRSRA